MYINIEVVASFKDVEGLIKGKKMIQLLDSIFNINYYRGRNILLLKAVMFYTDFLCRIVRYNTGCPVKFKFQVNKNKFLM